jgi:hypothetical protein
MAMIIKKYIRWIRTLDGPVNYLVGDGFFCHGEWRGRAFPAELRAMGQEAELHPL